MSETEYFSSDFEPFGFLEFSGQEPLAKRIYDSLRESLGDAFVGADQDAGTYADAMCFAAAQMQIDCAAAQDDPNQANYLLEALERDYKILVPHGATIEERRTELLAAQLAAAGSRRSVIQDGLFAILGDELLGWRFMKLDPSDENSEVKLHTLTPVFVPPTTTVKVIQFTETIMPGEQIVAYKWITRPTSGLTKGDKFTVDLATFSTKETVTVDPVSFGRLRATFTKPHNPGVTATTAPQPFWSSTKSHCMIVVSDLVLNDPTLIAKVHAFMRKALPATATWALCQTVNAPYGAYTGPFTVGYGGMGGRIGQSPLSPLTSIPVAE